MTVKTSDGVDIYILPDCAKCKFTGEYIEDMDECPCCDSGICTPDTCFNYDEDWSETDMKGEKNEHNN